MITVRLMGGLGNQMFQYAAGRSLAAGTNTTLKLDISFLLDRTPVENFTYRDYELNIFNIQEHIANAEDVAVYTSDKQKNRKSLVYKLKKFLSPAYILRESNYHIITSKRFSNLYMDGYWQSEYYFENFKELIRREFTFKNNPDCENQKIISRVQAVNSVGIHIRRSDYVTNPIITDYHGVCDLSYYQHAMHIIESKILNPYYFVFSDDPEWAKQHIKTKQPLEVVDYNLLQNQNAEDLRLMSACKNNIIANSSFSWWGAWLNNNPDKIVVAPQRWLNEKSVWYKKFKKDTSRIVPADWIKA